MQTDLNLLIWLKINQWLKHIMLFARILGTGIKGRVEGNK